MNSRRRRNTILTHYVLKKHHVLSTTPCRRSYLVDGVGEDVVVRQPSQTPALERLQVQRMKLNQIVMVALVARAGAEAGGEEAPHQPPHVP